jgi:hypothetical protein
MYKRDCSAKKPECAQCGLLEKTIDKLPKPQQQFPKLKD